MTMYTIPERFLFANPLNRYSIGDRTKGLAYGKDGSLTIYVSNTSPGKDKESNWLPAPDDELQPGRARLRPRQGGDHGSVEAAAAGGGKSGREERYWIVAFTVMTDVPEAVGPCPVALMAKLSLPLYFFFALYS